MKVLTVAEIDREQWDCLCDTSSEAWLFHRSAWMQIETRFFSQENLSFGLFQQGRLIAIQPLYLSYYGIDAWNERLLNSGIHRQTGLALAFGLPRSDVSAARSAAMKRIFELAHTFDVDRIQLNSHNLALANRGTEREEIPFWVLNHGFQLGLNFSRVGMLPSPGMATCNADQILDLSLADDALWSRLDDSCRRAVRKANSHSLRFVAGSDGTSIEQYYFIAKHSAQRTGENLPPIEYYREIWTQFFPQHRCAFLFAQHGNTFVAGLVLLFDKGGASFLAGASHPDFLPMRVNDFLHWSAVLWAKNAGMRYYRFGPTFPEVPKDWPIARVSAFKGKFGARSYTIIQGSHFRRPRKYLDAAIAHLSELCRNPPGQTLTSRMP